MHYIRLNAYVFLLGWVANEQHNLKLCKGWTRIVASHLTHLSGQTLWALAQCAWAGTV